MSIVIYFFNGNDINTQRHYAEKEYRNDITVEINGLYYEVYFFTARALEYEMRQDGFFSLPGIIIVDDISNNIIFSSISTLAEVGYFERFVGRETISPSNSFMRKWYLNVIDFKTENLVSYKLQ